MLPAQSSHNQKRTGQAQPIRRAIVTGNEDVRGLQRHDCTSADKAGQTILPPAARILPCPYWDPPQFPVGSSGLIAALEGDGHNLAMLGIELNDVNPTDEKEDAVLDDSRYIPGESVLIVGKNRTVSTSEKITLIAGRSSITMEPDGTVTIQTSTVNIKAATTNVSGNFNVKGKTNLTGAVTMASTAAVTGTLSAGGMATMTGGLSISGGAGTYEGLPLVVVGAPTLDRDGDEGNVVGSGVN